MKIIKRFLILYVLLHGHILTLRAQDSLAIAEEMYSMGMELYDFTTRKQAKEMFIQASEFNPTMAKAFFMAGKATLLTVHKEEALPYLQTAYRLDTKIDDEIIYLIGQAYQYGEKFEDAIKYFQVYRLQLAQSLSFDKSQKVLEVDWKIFECRNAVLYLAHPVDVDIINLPDNINTEYSEYAPVISADEKKLIFTSRRPDNSNPNLAADFEFYEDIYQSDFVDGQWQAATPFPAHINGAFHNSNIGLSADGKILYIYTDENGGDILESDYIDGTWTAPKPVRGLINTPYLENGASISGDNKTMYFTSNKPGGYGGTDIYVSRIDKNGRWGKAQNLGSNINTARDEESPFISKSGQHLYFSSNGRSGMGGLDIYVAEREANNTTFSSPVNLGYPINSVANDVFFVLSGDENSAYYSSVKGSSKGEEDIYKVNMQQWQPINVDSIVAAQANEIEAELNETKSQGTATSTAPATVVTGVNPDETPRVTKISETKISLTITVLDAQTLDTLEAKVVLIAENSQLVTSAIRNKAGSYEISFTDQEQAAYKVKIINKAYLPYESTIHVVGKDLSAYKINETIALQRLENSLTGIINVYFGHDSADPYNYEDLQYLELMMKNSPNVVVEIAGYTDNTGHVEYNKQLSQRRANAVKNYLVEHGVETERITAEGYGIVNPIGDNTTKEGRRLNRRIEFKILAH